MAKREREEAMQIPQEIQEMSKGIGPYQRGRYPNQTRPLPSEEASEDNKERQDEAALNFAKRIAKGVLGGSGAAASYIAEGIKGKYAKGGKVKSASSRADGIAQRGKTRGKYI